MVEETKKYIKAEDYLAYLIVHVFRGECDSVCNCAELLAHELDVGFSAARFAVAALFDKLELLGILSFTSGNRGERKPVITVDGVRILASIILAQAKLVEKYWSTKPSKHKRKKVSRDE